MQLYPGWSARDNYGYGAKKKKRKKERSADPGGTLSSSARTAVS
jgi:transcription factor 7-like 2